MPSRGKSVVRKNKQETIKSKSHKSRDLTSISIGDKTGNEVCWLAAFKRGLGIIFSEPYYLTTNVVANILHFVREY